METIGGIPVECLTGELAGVWSGWRILGDREVVREASAKGTHVTLAQKCLSTRRNCPLAEAQSYFYREVYVWVEELLTKQQVFRATHILKNVGKDPKEHINSVCITTRDSKLRDYLVRHLVKIEGLEEAQLEAFQMIKMMDRYKERYSVKRDPVMGKSINEIIQMPQEFKTILYTDLYFASFDAEASKHLSSRVAWDYLLMKNKVDLIFFWIDVSYGGGPTKVPSLDAQVIEELEKVMKSLKIIDEMIDSVSESNAANIVKELILDRLARYGVFSSQEAASVKLVLTRLLNNGIAPSEFKQVLSQPNCNINGDDFLSKLNVELYSKSYLEENQIKESDAKIRNLCISLDSAMSDSTAYDTFEKSILSTVDYLSDNAVEYLRENPLVMLSIIFAQHRRNFTSKEEPLSQKLSLKDIFIRDTDLELCSGVHISKEVLQNTLDEFPHLQKAVRGESMARDATMYQLLNGFEDFNAARGFAWRKKMAQMPTFFNEYLVNRYGHKEKLTYVNYLKQGRPNMAARLLVYDQKKFHLDISSKMKCHASTEAHLFALRNLDHPEIMSACVSFVEIIGVDSENLRLHLTVAKRIREELGVSTGELLQTVVYNDTSDLNILSSYLDRCFKRRLTETLEEDVPELISAIKDWESNVRFSQAHSAPLPDTFLKYLVKRELCFEFLLVGQIFAYPSDQMLKLARKFSNPNVKGHLLACLKNPSRSRESVTSLTARERKTRDSRQSLYAKNLPRHSESNSESPTESGILNSSIFSSENGISAFSSPTDSDDDLWTTILKCHHSQDPPGSLLLAARLQRSPLLVVLASCYEPSSIPGYWCSWLVISTDESTIISEYRDCLEQQVWPADRVLNLLKRLVAAGYTKTMCRGLEVFMPENPLRIFAEFLTDCVDLGDFSAGQEKLETFKAACSNLVYNANILWTDTDLSYLKNLYWISLASERCTAVALGHSFKSTASQIEFLRALSSCDFCAYLPGAPNFQQLLNVVEILANTEVTLDFAHVAESEDWKTLDSDLRRCLAELARSENYEDALRLCKAADLDCSDIIIAQWRKGFAKSALDEGKVTISFWKNCAEDFERYHVSYEVAAQFYVEHAEKVSSHKERYEILKLAHETLKGTSANQQIVNSVEMAMWKSCFLSGPETANIDDAPPTFNKLKTELMSGLNELKVRCELTDPDENLAVEKLIDRFLDAANLRTALRIATIFDCKHRDLQVLMLCLSLAEGEISPYNLTMQQRMLMSSQTRLKNQRQVVYTGKGLPKMSSPTLASQQNPFLKDVTPDVGTDAAVSVLDKQEKIDCIVQLEKLLGILIHGILAGRKILLCYRLAAHLRKSYQSLLTLNDPIEFLEEIVAGSCDYKLEVIKDVVAAYDVNNRQLAEFLSEKIVATITKHVEGGHVDQPITMWGYPLDGGFRVVTELCSEPSLLGSKLLEVITRLLGRSYGENRDVVALKTIVELLIKSHDCFTAACNMEGIASILRKSQQLANSLQNLKQWGLLVRLLTGVGRFTEMNYILQILKENEQFEFLLTGRGLDKISGFKTALLDFLKPYCSENKDLFNLVAHRFRLYFEIALSWEQEAKEAIDWLLTEARVESRIQGSPGTGEIRLTKNEATEKRLQLAMINFTHATEYYFLDSKLTLAYQCCHRAELVALQISFLHSVNTNQQVPCVMKLGAAEIDRMISADLSFSQANVLARAYNHPVDWGSVIYAHCITQCDAKYLKDFMTTNELTVAIVKDSVKRYQLEKYITKQMADSMQQLISKLKDVECKYTLASQLGFKNVIENILGNANVTAYLKDTVWRKGYSSTAFD